MTAPRRILDDHDLDGRLRRAVRAARAVGPGYDVGRGADRFEAMLAGVPASGAASSSAATRAPRPIAVTPSRSNAFALKATLVTGVLVLLGAGIYTLSSRDSGAPAEMREAPASSAASPVPPSTAAVGEGASETNMKAVPIATSSSGEGIAIEALPSASSAKPAAGAVAKRSTISDEREREVLHLAKLQRIAATDPAQAIDLAKAGHAEFPRGILYQEREVILVEALAGAGRKSEASERARAFVKAYPKNPSASHLRALADATNE